MTIVSIKLISDKWTKGFERVVETLAADIIVDDFDVTQEYNDMEPHEVPRFDGIVLLSLSCDDDDNK